MQLLFLLQLEKTICIKALRELEKEKEERERCANNKADVEAESHKIDELEFEHSAAVTGVYFTCDLLGDDLQLTKIEVSRFYFSQYLEFIVFLANTLVVSVVS